MRRTLRIGALLLLFCLAGSAWSCTQLKGIQRALTTLAACQFKLDSVRDFQLAGISLTGKTGLSLLDAPKAAAAFAGGRLPASFVLNVAAVNPNRGEGGTPAPPARLVSLPWTLVLDNTITVRGNLAEAVTIPAGGAQTLIPLRMELDLIPFFKDKGYENILNLALALGGANGSPARITLRARPEIQTDLGPIRYPGEIDIIDREFRAR